MTPPATLHRATQPVRERIFVADPYARLAPRRRPTGRPAPYRPSRRHGGTGAAVGRPVPMTPRSHMMPAVLAIGALGTIGLVAFVLAVRAVVLAAMSLWG